MTKPANRPGDPANLAYCTFWDWKEDPPYEEISSRINSLLGRGAKQIHIYDAEPGSGDTHEIVIAARELTPDKALRIWSAFSDVMSESGYDWTKDEEPIRVDRADSSARTTAT